MSVGNNKRKLWLMLRKRIRVLRRFNVEWIEGSTLKYTCRTCGHSQIDKKVNPAGKPFNTEAMKKLAAYQNHSNGASGICEHCTKKLRDERYPLAATCPK